MPHPFKRYLEAQQLEFGSWQYVGIFTDDGGVEEAAWVHNPGSRYEEDVSTNGWPSSYHLLRLQTQETEHLLICLKKLNKAIADNDLSAAQAAQQGLVEAMEKGGAGLIDWLVGDIWLMTS